MGPSLAKNADLESRGRPNQDLSLMETREGVRTPMILPALDGFHKGEGGTEGVGAEQQVFRVQTFSLLLRDARA